MMTKPNVPFWNESGELEHREMTDEEYADLLASGWTLEPQEETPTE